MMPKGQYQSCLNPYLVGRWFRRTYLKHIMQINKKVLILIWLEDGLEAGSHRSYCKCFYSLNPYLVGRWFRRYLQPEIQTVLYGGLNPYLVGRWFRRAVCLIHY